MKHAQLHKPSLAVAASLMPLALLGCGEPTEIAGTNVSAPPAARIGNVATADLEPVGADGASGYASFAQLEQALRVEISASGLPQGEYTVTLRDDDACAQSDADARDFGDLGHLTARADGSAAMTRQLPDRSLIGDPGVVSRSVVIHEGTAATGAPEDTQHGIIACGVIEWGTDSLADNR